MPANIPFLPGAISDYIDKINSARQTSAEVILAAETKKLPATITPMQGAENQQVDVMRISVGQSRFLTMLVEDLAEQHPERPMKGLDIGTFTGSSAGALAQGMVYGGKLITCDIDSQYTQEYQAIAKNYWKFLGVVDRIEALITPATEVLQDLLDRGEQDSFDIVFIDADKANYNSYYELALTLLRFGGKIILDNMLWSGRVANSQINDRDTNALRNLNEKIAADPRVKSVLLSDEDGIMIVKKLKTPNN